MCCKLASSVFLFAGILFLVFVNIIQVHDDIEILMISSNDTGVETDPKFLSFALDSSMIAKKFKGFNMTDLKLQKLVKALSPAYFRIGGTMADRLRFINIVPKLLSKKAPFDVNINDGGRCSFAPIYCFYVPDRPNFTMDTRELSSLYEFAQAVDSDLLFDLNSLRRNPDGSWDQTNAEELIDFAASQNFTMNWELGNEPDSYRHQFDYEVNATQLAKDFKVLRDILQKYPQFQKSSLVGPDTTRPRAGHLESVEYLKIFAKNARDIVDAITWHQYYFDGRSATVKDFLDPLIFDVLQWEITQVKDALKSANISAKPLWLGETSSAYGGGAPGLSDRYVASFIWLDKLGLSAKSGLKVVTRQSIYQGHYALLDENYDPSPDWWISVLYKKLVGRKVVDCKLSSRRDVTRLYCHCAKGNFETGSPNVTAVTIFGVNLSQYAAKIRVETVMPNLELTNKSIYEYQLTTDNYLSRDIYLNGELLKLTKTYDVPTLTPKIVPLQPHLVLSSFSLVFWVVPMESMTACAKLV